MWMRRERLTTITSLHGIRPHGGIAVMWRKTLGDCCVLPVTDKRIMMFEIKCDAKKLLFVNVYMPYCTSDNLDEFLDYLGKINSIIEDADTPFTFVMGDFNAHIPNNAKNKHEFGNQLK